MGTLDGKAIVVTGGGRGIGRAIALKAAAEGAHVLVVDNGCEIDGNGADPAIAQAVAAQIVSSGGTARAVSADVSDEAGADEAIRAALDAFGRIDGLITCAGIRRDVPFWHMTEDDWDAVIRGNIRATFLVTKMAAITMRQQRYGRIVMLTSDAGLGSAGASNYAAAGEGIIGLSRTVARDLGRYGVTCNAVSPFALSRMFGGYTEELHPPAGGFSPEMLQRLAAPVAATLWDGDAHPDAPESIAPLACYLASEGAEDVNGQLFGARGGEIYLYSYPAIDHQILNLDHRFTMDELDEQMPKVVMTRARS